jgi:hypothetical protein
MEDIDLMLEYRFRKGKDSKMENTASALKS